MFPSMTVSQPEDIKNAIHLHMNALWPSKIDWFSSRVIINCKILKGQQLNASFNSSWQKLEEESFDCLTYFWKEKSYLKNLKNSTTLWLETGHFFYCQRPTQSLESLDNQRSKRQNFNLIGCKKLNRYIYTRLWIRSFK